MICFISGHLDLSEQEFQEHYAPRIDRAIALGATFVIGDARGADAMAQSYLKLKGATAIVFHMFDSPRHNAGFPTKGGFKNDSERDSAMTLDSTEDLAWIRPGREKSGTAKNLQRRTAT
ncbi:hypothetical protein [Archangium lansingense]|uniref:DUF1330 domain-containing protein n=1 Tax=Archangium lansingense TaxID=2995310 RepID=A0ABT4AC32_9BACT|nr:hypothetical protein [Archangium lansinium]MCY1079238.1 hypothetical protein [Archangium lansinium]